ncbi:UNVERIFIED_CONTAM: hypothetical protein Scaly_1195000 [Sesamum calycinum]|uniref:Reverse transcriptase n=1 Tax=Sesamum calycinum TaxID=2727403 RepID=A0AAW2Q3R1_9LAMI
MNIDFFEEVRERALVRAAMYKVRMTKAYDSKVRPKNFQVGDLVLRKTEASGPIEKLDSKWEGPYKVTEIIGTGAYKLQQIDGRNIPRTWNIENLKNIIPEVRRQKKFPFWLVSSVVIGRIEQ